MFVVPPVMHQLQKTDLLYFAMQGAAIVSNGRLLNQGNSYTVWDDRQACKPAEEQQSPAERATPSARANGKRTKNFSDKEDDMLVLAWLNVSEQGRSPFWQRIHSYFHQNRNFESDRNQNSLQHRWSTMQEHVQKFSRCYDQIESTSGMTEKDKVYKWLFDLLVTSYVPFNFSHTCTCADYSGIGSLQIKREERLRFLALLEYVTPPSEMD
jgi:hypothetical protein